MIPLENPARVSRLVKQKKERREASKLRAARSHRKWAPGLDRSGLWKLRDHEAKQVSTSFCCVQYIQRQHLCVRYDLFLPLHHLWLGYMSELLALQKQPPTALPPSGHSIPNAGVMHAKLVKADFHGSIITGSSATRIKFCLH